MIPGCLTEFTKQSIQQESSPFLGDIIASRSVTGLSPAGGVSAGKREQARYRHNARFGYKPRYKNPGEMVNAFKKPDSPASGWSEIS